MSLAHFLIKLSAMTLPAQLRDRYREEWLADVEHAPELGVSRASVVVGALSASITLDRDEPAVTGIPSDIETLRRARWSAAFLCCALVIGGGAFVYSLDGAESPLGGGLLTAIIATMLAAAVCLAVIGVVEGIRALRIGVPAYGARGVATAILLGLGSMLTIAVAALFPIVGALWVMGAVGVALLLAAGGPRRQSPQEPMHTSSRVGLSAMFSVATVGVVAVGALHIFVWNPLAKMPGMSLSAIYDGMAAAGQSADFVGVGIWAALFVVTAVALPIGCALPRFAGPRSTRRIITAGSMLVATAAATSWLAGFGMGLSLADAFLIDGGDAAGGGAVLTAVTVLALVAAVFAALVPARWRTPQSTALLA